MAEPPLPNSSDPGESLPEASRGAPFSRALLIAMMVAVLYGALLLAVDGAVSLVLDRDVISEPEAGPLVGPLMAIAAVAVVFVSTLGGLRPSLGPREIPVVRSVSTGLTVLFAGPLIGSIAYVLGQDHLLTVFEFFIRYLVSPFVIVSAVLAGLVILFLPIIASVQSRAR